MLIIAHRGASGTYCENTREAFQAAYEMDAHGIETDVRRCPCHRKLKLSHDPITKDRCSKLADFFDVLPYSEWMDELHLDIKERGLAKDILRITKGVRSRQTIIYSSFLWSELLKIRFLRPSARIGLLWDPVSHPLRWRTVAWSAKVLGARSIHFNLAALDNKMVDYFRRRGFLIYAYSECSVGPKIQVSLASFLDLDGVFSDYPAYAREILWEMTIQ